MKNGNRRNCIQSHFAKRGLKFAVSEESLSRQLEKLLGEERFESWEEVRYKRNLGIATIQDEYAIFQTVEEMNLVGSSQAEIALDIAVWLCTVFDPVLQPKNKLLDLGCSVGNLASWIAESWPEIEVVGTDACEHFLQAANQKNKPKNLSFHGWNYALSTYAKAPTADVLICSLGIDFSGNHIQVDLDSINIRERDEYKASFEEAKGYFSNWRTAIRAGGYLFSVLRIANLTSFVAAADAATAGGWSLDLTSSTKLQSQGQELPALAFTAVTSEQLPVDLLTAFWLQQKISELFDRRLIDPFAGVVYRLLSDKKELRRSEKIYDDGNLARTIIGQAGPFAYRFTTTTLGFEAIQIVPAIEAASLQLNFHWFMEAELVPQGRPDQTRKKRS